MYKRSIFATTGATRGVFFTLPRSSLTSSLGNAALSIQRSSKAFSSLAVSQASTAKAVTPLLWINLEKHKESLMSLIRAFKEENPAAHRLYSLEVVHNKFHIHRPQVRRLNEWHTLLTTVEKILFFVATFLSFGIVTLLYFKPLIDFRHYQRSINKMRIDGRKLKFTGDFAEYRSIYYKNALLILVTFGVYAWWNQPEINIAHYLDSHIEWADSKEQQTN